jgi:hypothetical protein
MKFNEITEAFAESVGGTDDYVIVKKEMRALFASDPSHASAYFLVYGFARSYVILHDDEGIDPAYAKTTKAQLLQYMRQIEAAISTGQEALIDAMNRIVLHYDATSPQPF